MSHADKVHPRHLKRSAYLYIRQSSLRQVLENTESTRRQYGLRGRAVALGWADDNIVVVDSDQGESGASAAWRGGFQQLVADVGMGKAGIVMGLEVSRLARNNADWHRLLEICALSDTLILDEDGVYDPAAFNDRLLLGLKGTMSEAELHVLKARLRGGILTKARRGEYQCPLPIGFVYDPFGNVMLDPDVHVRETFQLFFEMFERLGSAHQVVRAFRAQRLGFPTRPRGQGGAGKVVFQSLTSSIANRVLHNPRYAGAYAFGRRRYRRTANGKQLMERLDPHEWTACIPEAHPGYITWERYQDNLKILASNAVSYNVGRGRPPREGCALLQGRCICGVCGSQIQVRYRSTRGRNEAWYVCCRANASHGAPTCQSIAGGPVDDTVGALVAQVVTPEAIELALAVRREIVRRAEEVDRLRARAVQRAEHDAETARQRYMMVDPHNRLVAESLEADWNQMLRVLTSVREDYERHRCASISGLDPISIARLDTLATDFQRLWEDPHTSARERKRMLAHIVEDVTLVKQPAQGTTTIHVRFKGGRTETLTTLNPKSSADQVRTPPEVVATIDHLLENHVYEEIAEILNSRGFLPGGCARSDRSAKPFDSERVSYVVHAYNLRSRFERLRDRGMLTKPEMAERLGISVCTLDRWAEHGLVTRHAYNGHSYLYVVPNDPPTKHCSRWDPLAHRAARKRGNGQVPDRRSEQPEEVQYESRSPDMASAGRETCYGRTA